MVGMSWPSAWWRSVPSIWRPVMRMAPTSHRLEWPVAHDGHLPQAGTKPNTTWSPGASRCTPGSDLLDHAGTLVAADHG